jgi:hypothetical protein
MHFAAEAPGVWPAELITAVAPECCEIATVPDVTELPELVVVAVNAE